MRVFLGIVIFFIDGLRHICKKDDVKELRDKRIVTDRAVPVTNILDYYRNRQICPETLISI